MLSIHYSPEAVAKAQWKLVYIYGTGFWLTLSMLVNLTDAIESQGVRVGITLAIIALHVGSLILHMMSGKTEDNFADSGESVIADDQGVSFTSSENCKTARLLYERISFARKGLFATICVRYKGHADSIFEKDFIYPAMNFSASDIRDMIAEINRNSTQARLRVSDGKH